MRAQSQRASTMTQSPSPSTLSSRQRATSWLPVGPSRLAEAPLRVAVVGAGALGALFGALLADAGIDTTIISRRREVVDHIAVHGVTVTVRTSDTPATLIARPGAVTADHVSGLEPFD